MFYRRILAILLFFIGLVGQAQAQEAAAVDSIKTALAAAKTTEEKAYWLDNLSRTLMNVNKEQSDIYGKQLIALAEESRDRKLMVDAYMSNGIRYGYFRAQKNFNNTAVDYLNNALVIAKQEKMDDKIASAQLYLSAMYLAVPDKEKAFKYVSEAFSRISNMADDSLKVEGNIAYGNAYLAANEKVMALRHYYTALRLAEESKAGSNKEKNRKAVLLRNSYLQLSGFYNRIGDYDKSIDYQALANKELDKIDEKWASYQKCIDLTSIGNLFSAKKNYDIAISYFERSIRLADSLKFSTLKVPGYISLLNQYLRMDQPVRALNYLNSVPGTELKEFLTRFGMSFTIDQAYGYVYTELDRLDSARVYLNKALPFFEQSMNETSKVNMYLHLGSFYTKTGETDKAISYYLKSKETAEKTGLLEVARNAAKNLDTLYTKKGDYKMASLYSGIYYRYKDSIEKLNKEKEIAQEVATDEKQRNDRMAKEKEEARKKRYSIQYLAITIGIAAFFVMLVMMGMFKVSEGTIKAIGFFVFIMLFEFVFLLFKKRIAGITGGEPWKDLLFMIGLAALLLPVHHWLEHNVIRYLTSHNRLTQAGHHIKNKLFKRNKE